MRPRVLRESDLERKYSGYGPKNDWILDAILQPLDRFRGPPSHLPVEPYHYAATIWGDEAPWRRPVWDSRDRQSIGFNFIFYFLCVCK